MNDSAKPLQRVVLGLTGGIAAYKAAEFTRLLVKEGIVVDVVMTEAATRFIAPMTLQALSGNPVLTDLWDSGSANAMGHIDLSRHADAIVSRRHPRISSPSSLMASPTTCCLRSVSHGTVRF